MNYYFSKSILAAIFFYPVLGLAEDQLAFPGAEGYGKYTVGGVV